MAHLTRRSVLRGSVALGAAHVFAAPHIARAAATTATVWFAQGFVQDEDVALRKAVADYEKASGNKIELSITPFAPERQKIIAALTSGVVPDMMANNPAEILQIYGWQDRWVDVSDVVDTQKALFSETALVSAQAYNNVTKKVGTYGVPLRAAVVPCHIWRPLVEKAGLKIEDIPKTWDAYFDFFKKVQDNLRKQGERKVYGLGFQVTANGVDPYNLFMAFLIAHGGQDIVTKDGKLHLDDPKVKQAAIKATAYLGGAYRDGYVPPSAINWNDADDNNAFHSKLCVMDFDGTLSTELAMLRKQKAEYNDVITMPPPLDNSGQKMVTQMGGVYTMIPKGAKNIEVAKDFQKFIIQPEVNNEFLKGGIGRYMPSMPEVTQNDSWWTDPKRDSHVPPYVEQGLVSPTKPDYFAYNPAWAQVRSEHPFQIAFHETVANNVPLKDSVAKAIKRVEEIFAKYQIKA